MHQEIEGNKFVRLPRLPGTDKLSHKFGHTSSSPAAVYNGSSSSGSGNFTRGTVTRSSCPTTGSLKPHGNGFVRNDVKRKPVLPISGKMTSRMLSNTTMALTVDSVDCRVEEPISSKAVTMRTAKANSQSRIHPTPSRKPSFPVSSPVLTRDKMDSCGSDTSGSSHGGSPQVQKYQNHQPDLFKGFNWMNYRSSTASGSSRLSSSSQSSWNSEEDIWIPRKS